MTTTEGQHERRLKVPHTGWSDVQPSGDHYYFVHSYYVCADEPSDVLWSCTYGSVTFAAAVRRDNVYGCQFHPEKSQEAGLRFLRAFLLGSRV
jgi:glutamine amidotransferase